MYFDNYFDFIHKFDPKVIQEVDVNGQPINDDAEQTSTDYTGDEGGGDAPEPVNPAGDDTTSTDYTLPDEGEGDQPAQDDQTTDTEGEEDQGNPPNEGEETGDTGEGETTDYTSEGDDTNPEADSGDEQPTDDDSSNDTEGDDSDTSDQQSDRAKEIEAELFASLTPEQMAIKHRELKTLYSDLYDSINGIIDRVNEVPKSEEYIKTYDYISNTLSNLKDMITDYVSDVYDTKSYTENAINYNKYLAVLDGVNKILAEIDKKDKK